MKITTLMKLNFTKRKTSHRNMLKYKIVSTNKKRENKYENCCESERMKKRREKKGYHPQHSELKKLVKQNC